MTRLARSVTSSMSSVHTPVDRYFHPPSLTMVTMTPSSISAAHLTAAAMMAPDDMPANIPASTSLRVHSTLSRGPMIFDRSRREYPSLSRNTGGMNPSSRF